MNDILVAVGSGNTGVSPVMPYIDEKLDGTEFAENVKYLTELALLRCGFDIADRKGTATPQEMAYFANRHSAECCVMVSCSAFGSRKSFNDVNGCVIKYGPARDGAKELAEDVCFKLGMWKSARVEESKTYSAACATITAECGYITNFDEAKLMFDPDYRIQTAEHIAMGLCEYFSMPYIPRGSFDYPLLDSAKSVGLRGKSVKLLQAALCAYTSSHAVEIDGAFGTATAKALRSVCTDNGIDEWQSVGAFWNGLLNPPHEKIRIASRAVGVRYVQNKLRSKLYPAQTTGVADEQTFAAVNEFLSDMNSEDRVEREIPEHIIKLLTPLGGGRARLF